MANIRKRDPEEMKRIAGQINSLMEQYRSKRTFGKKCLMKRQKSKMMARVQT